MNVTFPAHFILLGSITIIMRTDKSTYILQRQMTNNITMLPIHHNLVLSSRITDI